LGVTYWLPTSIEDWPTRRGPTLEKARLKISLGIRPFR